MMTNDSSAPLPDDFVEGARKSQKAGIADETAAFDIEIEGAGAIDDNGEQKEPSDEEAAAQLGSLS